MNEGERKFREKLEFEVVNVNIVFFNEKCYYVNCYVSIFFFVKIQNFFFSFAEKNLTNIIN